MTLAALTIKSTFPRLSVDASSKSAITTLTDDAAGWKSEWDNEVIPSADSQLSDTPAELAQRSNLNDQWLALGLAGWIEDSSTYHDALLAGGLYLADNSAIWDGFTARREQIIGLAHCLDFVRSGVISPTTSELNQLASGMVDMCSAGWDADEYIDGHSGGNQMAQLIGAISIDGITAHQSSSDTIRDQALDYFFGASSGDPFRLASERYFHADGGSSKGSTYTARSLWIMLGVVDTLHHACSAITVDGVAYEPYEIEEWVAKLPEWCIRMFYRGDEDVMQLTDRTVLTEPFYLSDVRYCISLLIKRGSSDYSGTLQWLHKRLVAKNVELHNDAGGAKCAEDILHFDPTAQADEAIEDNSTIEKKRLWDPSGTFVYDSAKNPTLGTRVLIEAKEYDFRGHQHLTSGGMQIWVQNDCVLLWDGKYGPDLGSPHNRAYYQQGISHSGVPLIDDPSVTQAARNEDGQRQDYSTSLGGPCFKQFSNNGTIDPPDIDVATSEDMRTQGDGMSWRRAGTDISGSGKFRIVNQLDGQHCFLHADTTHAYVLDEELATASTRVTDLQNKWLLIEAGVVWSGPVILRMWTATASSAGFKKRDHWHSNNAWMIDKPRAQPNTLRMSSSGRSNVGLIYIDYYDAPQYSSTTSGGTVTGSGAFTADMFKVGGAQFSPSKSASARQLEDIGSYRLEVSPVNPRVKDRFFCVMFPGLAGTVPPFYTWFDDGENVGVDFGDQQIYKLSIDDVSYVVPGIDDPPNPEPPTEIDTSPPNAPIGVSASPGAAEGDIELSWSPNTDDASKYQTYYREKI